MSSLSLEFGSAHYDTHRGGVIIPSRGSSSVEVLVTHDAIEGYASCDLTPSESVNVVIESSLSFLRMALFVPAHEDIITITSSIVDGGDWDLPESSDEGDE